jgi:hypothetical protein
MYTQQAIRSFMFNAALLGLILTTSLGNVSDNQIQSDALYVGSIDTGRSARKPENYQRGTLFVNHGNGRCYSYTKIYAPKRDMSQGDPTISLYKQNTYIKKQSFLVRNYEKEKSRFQQYTFIA